MLWVKALSGHAPAGYSTHSATLFQIPEKSSLKMYVEWTALNAQLFCSSNNSTWRAKMQHKEIACFPWNYRPKMNTPLVVKRFLCLHVCITVDPSLIAVCHSHIRLFRGFICGGGIIVCIFFALYSASRLQRNTQQKEHNNVHWIEETNMATII